jgi:SulP family sulfate permease
VNEEPVTSETRGGRAADDAWAGVAAAAVVLPQAMAFGVALVGPAGVEAATGAFAGLVAAAALCLASGLAGGTRGLISAPTGPTLVLLTGAAAPLMNAGLSASGLLAGLAVVVVLTGLFQMLIALTGGGRLIKFIPYSVVAGFMTGSAILMVLSQLEPLAASDAAPGGGPWRGIPVLTAALTLVLVRLVPRWIPAVPGTVAGLVGGMLFFQLAVTLSPHDIPGSWVVGALPGIEAFGFPVAGANLHTLPWSLLVLPAATLAVLASLDTLLTSVIADVRTGARHDARRELLGQGAGHVLSGLLGGMAGAGTTAATLVAVRSGGRRWTGVCAGLGFALLLLVGGPVGTLLPISALAGIVLHVAVGMVERDIAAWLRRRRTRADGVIALLVTAVTVGYDLMLAVGVGVAIAVVLFVRAQVRAPVIHRRSTGLERRSVRMRTDEERTLLDRHGDRIVLYELRGNLFFATAEQLFSELAPDLDRPAWVILHLRRVHQVDLTGIKLLQQIAHRLDDHGGELVFCEVHRGAGIGHKVKKTLRKVSPTDGGVTVRTFNGSDEALEYAEGALLAELGFAPRGGDRRVALGQTDVCRAMSPDEVESFSRMLQSRVVKAGEKVFSAGDEDDELYLVATGEIDLLLPTTAHHHKRLAKCGPGTLFGEVAFIEAGTRTADAVAVADSELLTLSRTTFERLADEDPGTARALLAALARIQSERLRWAAHEIGRLAAW